MDAEGENETVATAYEVLKGLHRKRSKLSLPELVQAILEESRLVEFALTQSDGEQAAANLLAIADQARAFTAAGGGGPRAFTRWLSQNSERQQAEVDADVAEESDDVIRILTMHGAKGLEFPIVVLGTLATAGSNTVEPVPDESGNRLHFYVGNKDYAYGTPGHAERWEVEKVAQDAESMRLLYVATTRARDHLVIPQITGKRKSGGLVDAIEGFLPDPDESGHEKEVDGVWLLDAERLDPPAEQEPPPRRPARSEVTALRRDRSSWLEQRAELLDSAKAELELTVASTTEREARPLAAEASHSAGALLASEGPPLEIGEALHLVMERVDLPEAGNLEPVTLAACAEAQIEDHADEVMELARRCLTSPTVKHALESGTYRREVPFTVMDAGGPVVGRVDLVFKDGDELRVIDFKTDALEGATPEAYTLEHHPSQAAIYQRALTEATGIPVREVTFVYCRSGEEVSVSGAE